MLRRNSELPRLCVIQLFTLFGLEQVLVQINLLRHLATLHDYFLNVLLLFRVQLQILRILL